MARRVAVIIGVGRYNGLTHLPGAVNGAREMAQWARDAGYEVILLTDGERGGNGTPGRVDAGTIAHEIDNLVQAGDVERLLVYFAGHGQSRGTDIDYWLLPPDGMGPLGSVNVGASVKIARISGIEHVILVADACRSSADRARMDVQGALIFPLNGGRSTSEVDQFWATASFDPALEVQASPESAYGVFTKVLLAGLRGEEPDAVVIDETGARLILPRTMKGYLLDHIPRRCAQLNLRQQSPDCRVESGYPPSAIAALPPPPTVRLEFSLSLPPAGRGDVVLEILDDELEPIEPPRWSWSDDSSPTTSLELPPGTFYHLRAVPPWRLDARDAERRTAKTDIKQRIFVGHVDDPRAPGRASQDAVTNVIDERGVRHASAPSTGEFEVETRNRRTGAAASQIMLLQAGERPSPLRLLARRRLSAIGQQLSSWRGGKDVSLFPSGSGISVVGALVLGARGAGADLQAARTDTHDAWNLPLPAKPQRDVRTSVPASILVQVAEPCRWLLTAVTPGYLTRLLVGAKGTRFTQFLPTEATGIPAARRADEERILDVAADAVEDGWWEVAEDSTSLVTQHLRSTEGPLNPTLALLRAYALFRQGRGDGLASLLQRFVDDHGWALHDLVMLLDIAGSSLLRMDVPVVPHYPLLTTGWALLPPEVPAWQAQARQALWPAPWATADGDDGAPTELLGVVGRGDA
jgi:Caspase domain